MEVKVWEYEEYPGLTEEVEGAVHIPTTGDEPGVYHWHDIPYAEVDGHTLVLQILEPYTRNEPEKLHPCFVFVQGSAWGVQDVYKSCPHYARLAARGYVVAVVQYRHSGIAHFPAPIQDARNAVRFMRLHAADYHLDGENFFLGGCSSGGHTAVFAALADQEPWLDASVYPGVSADVMGILDYYGAVSMTEMDDFPDTLEHHLETSPEGMEVGANLREHPELAARATAVTYIRPETKLPPVWIMHGTKDRKVSPYQSVRLYKKLKECGKEVTLYLVDGADHGGSEFWTPEAVDAADRFMKEIIQRHKNQKSL